MMAPTGGNLDGLQPGPCALDDAPVLRRYDPMARWAKLKPPPPCARHNPSAASANHPSPSSGQPTPLRRADSVGGEVMAKPMPPQAEE